MLSAAHSTTKSSTPQLRAVEFLPILRRRRRHLAVQLRHRLGLCPAPSWWESSSQSRYRIFGWPTPESALRERSFPRKRPAVRRSPTRSGQAESLMISSATGSSTRSSPPISTSASPRSCPNKDQMIFFLFLIRPRAVRWRVVRP